MLGFILIFIIGKYFYKLAERYQEKKWLFAIIGVLCYYFGTFIFGLCLALYYELVLNESAIDSWSIGFDLLAIPFGFLACWGLYQFLKAKWNKKQILKNAGILDAEQLK